MKQNDRRDHSTMQQDVLLYFWVIFYTEMGPKYEEIILLSSSRTFLSSTSMENSNVVQRYSFLVVYPHFLVVFSYGKKLQNATHIRPLV